MHIKNIMLPCIMFLSSIAFLISSCSPICLKGKDSRSYWVYEDLGDFDKALEQLEFSLKYNNDVDTYYHLGYCYYKKNSYHVSSKYFKDAILLLADNFKKYNYMENENYQKAELFFTNSKFDSSAIYYEKAIPSSIGFCRILGTRFKLE